MRLSGRGKGDTNLVLVNNLPQIDRRIGCQKLCELQKCIITRRSKHALTLLERR